jgi:hypothetical protein
MKSPMHQRPDAEARDMTEDFIRQYARGSAAGEAAASADQAPVPAASAETPST